MDNSLATVSSYQNEESTKGYTLASSYQATNQLTLQSLTYSLLIHPNLNENKITLPEHPEPQGQLREPSLPLPPQDESSNSRHNDLEEEKKSYHEYGSLKSPLDTYISLEKEPPRIIQPRLPSIPSLEDQPQTDLELLTVTNSNNPDESVGSLHSLTSFTIEEIKKNFKSFQEKLWEQNHVRIEQLVKLELLGCGSFGRVSRVFDKENRTYYALKEIRKDSFKDLKHFEYTIWQEIYNIIVLYNVGNPSLLKVLCIEVNETEGLCEIVMEVGRGTLQEYSEFRKKQGIEWKEDELKIILWQLISQVNMLKKINMFHRDIKPANIILCDGANSFKLTDFGCSRVTKKGKQVLNVCGTPFFMSPELFNTLGKGQPSLEYDPYLTDLYSVGATILKVIDHDIKREDSHILLHGKVQKNYPELYKFICKLMGEGPERRKAAKEIMQLKLRPFESSPEEDKEYKSFLFERIVNKNNDLSLELYFKMFIFEEAEILLEKQIKKVQAKKDVIKQIELTLALIRCYVLQEKMMKGKALLEELLQMPELYLPERRNRLAYATALFYYGGMLTDSGQMSSAKEQLNKALAIRQELLGDTHPDVAKCYTQIGLTYIEQGEFQEAMCNFRKSLEINSICPDAETDESMIMFNTYGAFIRDKSVIQQLLKNFQEVRFKYIKTDLDLSMYHIHVGTLQLTLQTGDAEQSFARAIEVTKRAYGENSPQLAKTYWTIGFHNAFNAHGVKTAEAYFNKSIELYNIAYKNFSDKNAQLVSYSYAGLGHLYFFQGLCVQALENFHKALDLVQVSGGELYPRIIPIYQLTSYLECLLGHPKMAYDRLTKILSKVKEHQGESPRLAALYLSYADACIHLNKIDDAQVLIDTAMAIGQKHYPNNQHFIGECYHEYGLLNFYKKDYAAAEEYFQKHLSLSNGVGGQSGKKRILTPSALYLAEIYFQRGDLDKAEETLKNARKSFFTNNPENSFTALLDSKLGRIDVERGNYKAALEKLATLHAPLLAGFGANHEFVKEYQQLFQKVIEKTTQRKTI